MIAGSTLGSRDARRQGARENAPAALPWPRVRPVPRAHAAEEQLLNEPLYQDLRPRVLELVERSQRARGAESGCTSIGTC